MPLEVLRPHEQIIDNKVDQLERVTHRWNAYTKPLLLDLLCVPCVLIDYLEDDTIELDLWPNSGRETISKQDVIDAALSGELMLPKTSRHRLSDHLPPIAVPLSRLRQPAVDN